MYIIQYILPNNKKNTYINNNIYDNNISNFIDSFFTIIIIDFILCILLGLKARYFQLHTLVNTIITVRILPDVIKLINDPINNYRILNNNYESMLILSLHLYHILISKKLSYIELFHHILFVGLGIIPSIIFIKTNQIYLGYIACSGIPGIFEYGLLTLLKNNIINSNIQKKYTAYLYNYFRYPLAILGCYTNYFSWRYNKIIKKEILFVSFYINIFIFKWYIN